MKKLIFGLLSLTLLATACKKDKDAPAITKENLAGNYKIMSIKASLNGSTPEDVDTRDACEKDDIIELKADNSYGYHDEGTVCDPAGDFQGTWSLNNNIVTSDDGEVSGTVTSFDGTNLELTITSTEGGMTVKLITTLKRQ